MPFIEQYLTRIHYPGIFCQGSDVSSARQNLKNLTYAHTLAVPFETIDLALGKEISLEIPDIFQKIVSSKRGGYCYELNLLFGELLKSLGFDVKYALAHLFSKTGVLRADSVHLVLIISLKDPWLVDVSWGRGLSQPLNLSLKTEQIQNLNRYRCVLHEKNVDIVEQRYLEEWKPIYRLRDEAFSMQEVLDKNIYHQQNPLSEFYRQLVVVQALKEGFISIEHGQFTRQERGVKKKHSIDSEALLYQALKHFNLAHLSAKLWTKL